MDIRTLSYFVVIAEELNITKAAEKLCMSQPPLSSQMKALEEELDTEIIVEKEIGTIEYDYPTFHISMKCFWCSIKSGELKLLEHEDAKWISLEEIDSVDWLPADREILPKIKEFLK